MEPAEFFAEPYVDRQLVVFTDEPAPSAAINSTSSEAVYTSAVVKTALDYAWVLGASGTLLALGARYLIGRQETKNRTTQSSALVLVPVPKSWASFFHLPPGHPRNRVIYVGHPVKCSSYVPVADFHRFTFEHKFSEVLSLLMYLGAKKITVEYVQGWGRDFSSKLSVGLPLASAGAEVGAKQSKNAQMLYQADFEGTVTPALPPDLVWYPYESTWKQVAEGRLKFGLKNFSLYLQYNDDYGINAGLKAKAQEIGLDLGGQFESYQATTWAIQGSF